MKKTILFAFFALASAFFLSSCEDDGNGKLDSDSHIYINGRNIATNKATTTTEEKQKRLTVEEICKGDSLCLCATSYNSEGRELNIYEAKFIADGSIDTINNRIALRAGNITGLEDNEFLSPRWTWYIRKFKWGKNYFEDGTFEYFADLTDGDTVAYIPSSQRLAVVDTLTTLFEDKDANWGKIYKIFNDAFIFIPCTGEEYRELEAAGLN